MRKMTKKAAILAAMSAMTAASASMAFAANQEENLSALDKADEVKAAAEAYGEWKQKADGNWTFTKEGGKKLQNTWAEIDGIWYYFDGENMAQDDFLYIDDKGYFFDDNGRLCTGWHKITSKMDAYSDITIPDKFRYYDEANDYVDINDAYDYEDFVWCYFDENGVAKENEWFQDTTGLWYYFDGNVMVKNLYNYEIDPENYDLAASGKRTLYGFDENGAMLTGWNSKDKDKTWNNPTADSKGKIWYYYAGDGKMQTSGWKFIGDAWYLFANYEEMSKNSYQKIGYPLITGSYIASYKDNKGIEYFYVNGDGKMQTDVVDMPKGTYKVVFYQEDKSVDVAYEMLGTSDKITAHFGSNGAATKAVENGRYYAMDTDNTAAAKYGTDVVEVVNNRSVLQVVSNIFEKNANDTYTLNGSTSWRFTDEGDDLDTVNGSKIETVSYYYKKEGNVDDDKLITKKEYNGLNNLQKSKYEEIKLPNIEKVVYHDDKEYSVIEQYSDALVALYGTSEVLLDYKHANNKDEIDDTTKIIANYFISEDAANDFAKLLEANGLLSGEGYGVALDGSVKADMTMEWTIATKYEESKKAVDNLKKSAPVQAVIAAELNEEEAAMLYDDITRLTTAVTPGAVSGSSVAVAINNILYGGPVVTYENFIKACDVAELEATRANALYESARKTGVAASTLAVYRDAAEDAAETFDRLQSLLPEVEAAAMEYVMKTNATAYETMVRLGNVADQLQNDLITAYNNVLEYNHANFVNKNDIASGSLPTDFCVKGELVKNAFIAQGTNELYLADNNGDFVTNKGVIIDSAANIVYDNAVHDNAYILFGKDGKAITGYAGTKKSITIAGITYWATDIDVVIGKADKVTVFVANKTVNNQR